MKKRVNKDKIKKLLRGFLRDIIIGVVTGVVISAITWYAGNQRTAKEIQKKLQTVGLGETKEYIEDIFGVPVVEVTYDDNNKYYSGLTDAYYKFDHCILNCVYSENTIIAFFVTVNKKNVYKVISNRKQSLGKFSYDDFFYTTPDYVFVNRPANNDDYYYYQEVYYGAGPADYNYYVLASYKDYMFDHRDSSVGQLISYFEDAGAYEKNTFESAVYETEECKKLRKRICPNTYGMICEGYQEIITVAVPARMFGAVLYDDWYNK